MKRWWMRLAVYTRAHALGLACLIGLMCLTAGLDVLRPWPLKVLIDSALSGRPEGSPHSVLLWTTGATVALFLAGWFARALQSYVQTGAAVRMTYDLGIEVFDHLQHLSLRFHGKQPAGDLLQRVINDTTCVRHLVFGVALPLLSSSVSLVWMAAIMFKLDGPLAMLAILVVPALGIAIRLNAARLAACARIESERQGQLLAVAEQILTSLPVVQAFGRERHEDNRFRACNEAAGTAYCQNIWAQLLFKVNTSAVTAAGTALVMLVGGIHVLRGQLSVGSLVLFLSYLVSLYAPIETLAFISTEYAAAAAGAKRVFEILEADDQVKNLPDAVPLLARDRHRVSIENVTFGYEPGRPVLHAIHLEARPGEMVALVGATGAGKSTILSLIPRFFDPWDGRVEIDGMDIRSLQISSVRSRISIVMQEPFLLPVSIAENIAYGRPSAGKTDVVAAAVAANAHEFIEQLPRGYDTVIGERGETLSGGQKQRLAIARALLKDAPILLLDEPTSALDAGSEHSVLQALDRVMKGRTTIVIAHRLSTVRKASRIVVINRGRVVEEGTHEDLLRRGGEYASLYRCQFETGTASQSTEVFAG